MYCGHSLTPQKLLHIIIIPKYCGNIRFEDNVNNQTLIIWTLRHLKNTVNFTGRSSQKNYH